ncbi:hypothetical protein L249_0547 [Ophiocordyceps polyrhachis-furcata BCC 54312]|uniref:Uncharacterized protein n=1 Tax=Ophiocordyceps polyrhachis-furcata BCC 54312 TaxID=1330021 RepID=A0A367LEG5_9HYPO|nr:hypothetical protein L249_0547 [Ophiocordyceps polyrhachis-furcata BCC 54312]
MSPGDMLPSWSEVQDRGRVNSNNNNNSSSSSSSSSSTSGVPHRGPDAASSLQQPLPPPLHQPQAAAARQYPPQQVHQHSALSQAASPSHHAFSSNSHPPPPQTQAQQQQHHHQYPGGMNGVNGAGMAMPGPAPTPAGHQAELNYIYGMVEELSKQLADNRRVTEDIVTCLGRVRSRARSHALNNDDLIASAADDLEADTQNLDSLVSILSEALEKSNHSRDANANLVSQFAHALALMLRQFHDYKARHVADMAAWHRSYRSQLDEARKENSRLREQVWEMNTHASRANECLRSFRRKYVDDDARWDRHAHDTAMRQELRFWKRMAMPELEDDDPYWSADDDIIDVAEKARQAALEQAAIQEQLVDSQRPDDDPECGPQPGGVAMQREEPAARAVPMPPPRPPSAASSTGSTGQ